MRSKPYLAAISTLALILVSVTLLVLPASGRGSRTALASTEGGAAFNTGEAFLARSHASGLGAWPSQPEPPRTQSLAAAPYTELVSEQTVLAPGASGALIATCPSGSVVVGGGYASNYVVLFYTQYKSGNGWRGDAKSNSIYDQPITVYAACLHNVPGATVTQVHGQVDVPSLHVGKAVATCPAGSIATAGGFHTYADGDLEVYLSAKEDAGEGWQARATNRSGSTRTFHAYVLCLSGTGGATTQVRVSTPVAPFTWGNASPTCESPALVTGGGFAEQGLIVYSSSGPYGDEWRVYAFNLNYVGETRTLEGMAICLALPPPKIFLPMVARNYAP
jgi:hypothetical protein